MGKALVQLVIIGLLFFWGGYLMSSWQGKRFSLGTLPTLVQQDGAYLEKKIESTVKPVIHRYLQSLKKKGSVKPAVPASASSKLPEKSDHGKVQSSAPPPERLDGLWLVKKPFQHSLSSLSYKEGALYKAGISSYGPPPQFKKILFDPKNFLHIDQDPTSVESSLFIARNAPRPGLFFQTPPRASSVGSEKRYWVQIASFHSFDKSRQAYLYLRSKGYEMTLHKSMKGDHASRYALRLKGPRSLAEAEKESLRIFKAENVQPSLVMAS